MKRKIAAVLAAGLLGLAGVACEASGDIDTEGDGVQLDGDVDVDDNNGDGDNNE